jgi:hypothetical protein
MNLDVKHICAGVDWQAVVQILKSVGMAHHEPAEPKKAFEASYDHPGL